MSSMMAKPSRERISANAGAGAYDVAINEGISFLFFGLARIS